MFRINGDRLKSRYPNTSGSMKIGGLMPGCAPKSKDAGGDNLSYSFIILILEAAEASARQADTTPAV
jgi:hypothetical protein